MGAAGRVAQAIELATAVTPSNGARLGQYQIRKVYQSLGLSLPRMA